MSGVRAIFGLVSKIECTFISSAILELKQNNRYLNNDWYCNLF